MTNVLFYLDPFFELNNPFKMHGWQIWYARIHEQLKLNLPDYDARLMALDAVELEPNPSFNGITIPLSPEDLRCGCVYAGNVFQKLEREMVNTADHEQLIIKKLGDFSPDVVFLITQSGWMRRALPKAVFFNCELNWFHYEPLPKFWSIDVFGYGKGRALLEHTGQILNSMTFGVNEKRITQKFIEVAREKLVTPPPVVSLVVSDLLTDLRARFSKIILFPLASVMPGDGETRIFASLDYYFSRLNFEDSCYFITLHPGAVAFSSGEIKYLSLKYPNVLIETKKTSIPLTQYLIPHVDCVVGNFSSIAYYALFFDIELIYIKENMPYQDDYSKLTAPVSELISYSDDETCLKILYWFITFYGISDQNFFSGKWMADFILKAIYCSKSNAPWLLYSQPLMTENDWMLHRWTPIEVREQFFYHEWVIDRQSEQSLRLNYLQQTTDKENEKVDIIHFVITIFSEQTELLADTLDSIALQTDDAWKLVVVAEFDAPNTLFDALDVLEWIKVENGGLKCIADEIVNSISDGWVALIQVGVLLDPFFVFDCRRYVNLFEDLMYIYVDEDCINRSGEFYAPKFKPDFNLELLRSTAYIGSSCLFQVEVLKKMGEVTLSCGMESYDLALNVFDLFGRKAFGHVSEVLLHVPDQLKNIYDEGSASNALSLHFHRNKLDVVIEKGWVDESFRVKYLVKNAPLVSILILPFSGFIECTLDEKLKFFKSCLGSVVEKTEYTNYEIVTLDSGGDSGFNCCVQELKERISCNIRVVEFSGLNNLAAESNFLVEQSLGEYFVFLQPNLAIIHGDWLASMLGYAQGVDVGIVRPRLILPTKLVWCSGEVLGYGARGVIGRANINTSMGAAGYMQRALLAQELSVVSAGCMMMKKSTYQNVNGMEGNKFTTVLPVVDLSLRITQLGCSIIYTPYVTLLNHVITMNSEIEEVRESEIDSILQKWLPQLANDTTYNRNLSLKPPAFKVDTSMNVHWDPNFRDKPKIYAFPPDSQGVGQYRVRAPINALTKAGVIESGLANDFDSLVYPTVTEIERIKPDVLFGQNGFLDGSLVPWKRYRKFNNAFMVSGLDDLVYMLPKYHPKQGVWPKNVRRKVKELFQASDRVIVANDALAEEFRKMSNEIIVVPNYLENWRWDSLNLPEKTQGKKMRVGWAGGSEHIADLEFIRPVVEALHKEVDWVFMGLCLEGFEPYIKEHYAGVDFDRYPQLLADLNLDLAIAPLMHNKFNECKTNLRLLEYGMVGWPVVCTDILPYQNAPVTRVANNTNEWVRVIREKINEPEELLKEGAVLKQWVVNNYMLDEHLDEWAVALLPG